MEKCSNLECCSKELLFKYKGVIYKVTDNPCKELLSGVGSYAYCYRSRCLERLTYFLEDKDFTFLNMEIERQLRDGDLVKI